jgi:hypothetical protein
MTTECKLKVDTKALVTGSLWIDLLYTERNTETDGSPAGLWFSFVRTINYDDATGEKAAAEMSRKAQAMLGREIPGADVAIKRAATKHFGT